MLFAKTPKNSLRVHICHVTWLQNAEVGADAAATSAAMQPPSRKKQQEAPAIHKSTTQKTPTRQTQRLPSQENQLTQNRINKTLNPKPLSPPKKTH